MRREDPPGDAMRLSRFIRPGGVADLLFMRWCTKIRSKPNQPLDGVVFKAPNGQDVSSSVVALNAAFAQERTAFRCHRRQGFRLAPPHARESLSASISRSTRRASIQS